jgi:two-component system C4-dicarboxylate transport sensor histidine kinase DctB
LSTISIPPKPTRRGALLLFAGGVVAMLVLAYVAQLIAGRTAADAVRAEARQTLDLQREILNGLLEKYRLMPPLLARRSDIRALFGDPVDDIDLVATAEAKAIEIAALSGALDVAFSDADGKVFASARGFFDQAAPQVLGGFNTARQGRLGREVVSLSDSERSYVFSSAVRDGPVVRGGIAVYVRFDQIEATWSLSNTPIAVAVSDGRAFLTNRSDWVLRPIFSGDNPIVLDLRADSDLVRLSPGPESVSSNGIWETLKGMVSRQAQGSASTVFGARYREGQRIMAKRDLPLLGWTLYAFADHGPVLAARVQAVVVVVLAGLLAIAVGWIMRIRRQAINERMRSERATSLRLERQVSDRTAKLTAANALLGQEVEDRKQAETQLRQAQSELVQAAKLAVIGQMSATLSHEYNQPLAAIRTNADNARSFLDLGKLEPAQGALTAISAMVDRISALSRSLLSFARKPGTGIAPVRLGPIIDEAVMLCGPRAKNEGVAIVRRPFPMGLEVMGGRIRLTQVLVNLVNNAVDAVVHAQVSDGAVWIEAETSGSHCRISVEDNGPGVPVANRLQIFEPFYTTKDVGSGLGIGLSVVDKMVRDLGGTIMVEDRVGGGARFVVQLALARDEPVGAEAVPERESA